MNNHTEKKNYSGFKRFAMVRVVLAVVLIVALVWGLTYGLDYLRTILPRPPKNQAVLSSPAEDGQPEDAHGLPDVEPSPAPAGGDHGQLTTPPPTVHGAQEAGSLADTDHAPPESDVSTAREAVKPPVHEDIVIPALPGGVKEPAKPHEKAGGTDKAHAPAEPPHAAEAEPETQEHRPPGVAFVRATIKPLEYELKHRWWGWRPNDIINVTDNVNHYQLGVLEVTRRTAVQLAERISRTGSTDAFNHHLENAMNWVMVSPDKYWFPSPESKYKDSLSELAAYEKQLLDRKASFYTRSDNIIPLLAAFEDLLGSCDENLVKATEKDGSEVSFFSTDNYFYYAKGIAGAMAVILEAVHEDFTDVLEKRNGAELLHHAIESCRRAADLDPWIITDGDLDGILANHRANMAAPISHAKFYLGQLIKTLST